MYRVHKGFLALALAPAVLVLSACGSSDTSAGPAAGPGMPSMGSSATSSPVTAATGTPGPTATGAHNQADIDFATAMIAHHAQAIQMARIVLKRTDNAQVKDLASGIEAAQAPEISMLSGWLGGWGAPVPATSMPMGAGAQMNGMMSDADLKDLETTSGSKGDALFLTQMTQHHRGAIAMAEHELITGSNPEAKELAQSIKKAQTAEVSEMKDLLASLG